MIFNNYISASLFEIFSSIMNIWIIININIVKSMCYLHSLCMEVWIFPHLTLKPSSENRLQGLKWQLHTTSHAANLNLTAFVGVGTN